jgi:hypothetical protein
MISIAILAAVTVAASYVAGYCEGRIDEGRKHGTLD